MAVLKLDRDNEALEIEFELRYLKTLTTNDRFFMMQQKSDEMKKLLRKHGYGKSSEIIKRA
jgi:hypothetical protein